jgi:hypothetical protein
VVLRETEDDFVDVGEAVVVRVGIAAIFSKERLSGCKELTGRTSKKLRASIQSLNILYIHPYLFVMRNPLTLKINLNYLCIHIAVFNL